MREPTCDVCGLVDPYLGQGDGIGSCDCPRCECGAAAGSDWCMCPPDDEEDDGYWAALEAIENPPERPVSTIDTQGLL